MSKKKLMALLLTGVMAASTVSVPVFAEEAEGGSSDTPLVIGQTNFSEKFSGLFHEAVPDQQIAENVGEYLFGSDRTGAIIYNGIEGETHEYNGTDYTYTGLSDVTVTEGEDETVYNFKLREGVTFSDGEPLTADDLIFTYYVLSDTDYDGNATFYSTNIKGMKNYRLNSTAADSITDEDVANTLADMPDEVAARVKDELMVPLLTSEYEWAQTAWEDYADAYGVTNGDEFFGMLYAADENYSVDGKDQDTIINEIADQYGKDYLALAAAYGDEAYFDEDAATIASEYLVEQKTAAGEGEEVANIEGIKKLGDYEVEVTTDGFEATTIYQLGVIVEPMHYYGDASLYDYDNNQFGFTRGDLSAVRDKSNQPLGAGPYKFVKYENKTVYMEANENYYKGAPKTKYLQWRETSDADKIAGVEQGTIDLSDPSGSKSAFDQIKSINGNDELSGDKIIVNATDNLGYGYIGLNANTINVGGEPGSDASKNLRKALTTVLAVYRDVAIDSYYGDAASVINYPISNTSWAAPQKSDADYQVAYSVDVDGNPLYTDDMTDDEKFAAATQAALGFFEAAGYTVENGKVTAVGNGTAEITVTTEDGKITASIMITVKVPDEPTINKSTGFRRLRARSVKQTKTSVTLQWNIIKDADGYFVYGNRCNTGTKSYKYRKLATITGGDISTWTQKDLKKGTYYKYVVKAYRLVNGKKVVTDTSISVHAVTGGGKYGNAKAVSVTQIGNKKNVSKITLKMGKTAQIQAKEVKKDKKIARHRKLCYESSNTKVATVTPDGLIRATGKGTCTIWVYAQNGVYKALKITVK